MMLHLAKYAGLLPALLLIESSAEITKTKELLHWQVIPAEDIACYMRTPLVDVIPTARAKLPLENMENCTLISFRTRFTTGVHLALITGNLSSSDSPLTRIHSSCVTGDILGSLRCDCGDQLHMALEQIRDAGNGLLIYLHQEGRGIGITNKLRAYQLQEQGYDTYDANLALGFDEDERDFGIAAAILNYLRVTHIRLLTNNPQKINAIEAAGIRVTERVPLITKSGQHNHAYLEAKAKKSGHLF
jgi:GTP cyclohydrolase II